MKFIQRHRNFKVTMQKMLHTKFILSLSSCVIFIYAGLIQDKLLESAEIHFDRLDLQCGGKNVSYVCFAQGTKVISTKLFIRNLTFVAREGGFKKLLLTIIIERCRSKENLDTCEQYLKQSNIDYCKAIDPDNFILNNSPFFVPFVPPVKCPINKGTYHAYNVTLNFTPFVLFQLDGSYWKTKYEVFSADQNKLVFCMLVEEYIKNTKSKRN